MAKRFLHAMAFKNVSYISNLVPKRVSAVLFTSNVRLYSSDRKENESTSHNCTLAFDNGLISLSLDLPSRQERCRFTLRPLGDTLADFIHYIKEEDHGVDFVAAYNNNGDRIAKQTPIHILVKEKFTLQINNRTYSASSIDKVLEENGNVGDLNDIKNAVVKLYSALNIEEFQIEREHNLVKQLESLKSQLQPLDLELEHMQKKAARRTRFLTWLGLGLMGAQFGLLARLTWWEYSWDIMEPVTYFVTYGTAMAMYAYFVVTRQDYNFPEVRDREYLLTIHREANKKQFNLAEYNRLKNSISQIEYDLLRLRDPLELHLPMQHLKKQYSVKQPV